MAKRYVPLWERHQRAFNRCLQGATKRAKLLDPATGGTEHLVRNWGNAASVAVWDGMWARWKRVSAAYEVRRQGREHAEHAAAGLVCLWCDYCTGKG